MNQSCLQRVAWYQALTLTERISSLDTVLHSSSKKAFDASLADRRMQSWHSQTPFATESFFAARLAMDGITQKEFRYLLGEPIEGLAHRFPNRPAWLVELEQAFSRSNPPNIKTVPSSQLPPGEESLGFVYAIEPLISQGLDRLHQGVQSLIEKQSDLPFDSSTVKALLFANLPQQLLQMLTRTMVLELNVARLQGLLSGETSRERLLSFLERLCERDVVLALLQEYPVLARQLVICVDYWVEASLEFIQRLCADWESLCAMFSPENEPGVLVQVDSGAGDSHRGGRSVIIAKFSSGFQLVYKPRSLAVDIHFQQLLTWINQQSDYPPFRTLKVLERGTYGWVEFVAAQACKSKEEVEHFYERLGGYLALLYALEATDFHSENLIASGKQPVLIDLESLFHPRKAIDAQESFWAELIMADSVLRVGLLPKRLWANAESEGVDLSGIGGAAGQKMPKPIPNLEGEGTDEMRIIRKQMELPGSQNRPRLNEAEVNVLEYTEAIVTGFTAVYQLLHKHRDELLKDNGLLTHFAEDEVRVVLRPTRTYGLLLQESFHPDVLRNALDRDRLFDRLWVEVQNRSYLVKVIPSERSDLWQGDIPLFTTRPNSRDLWSSANERFTDFFAEPGIVPVQRRLQQLNEQDLERQLWFIRSSLGVLAVNAGGVGWVSYPLSEPQTIPEREQLLAAACAVGDRLELLALYNEQEASWIGLTFVGGRHWSVAPLKLNLYDGVPGIALFLAYLGEISQEKRYTILAEAAIRTLQRQIERTLSSVTSIGGFEGLGGVIYTLSHLGTLWHQPELLRIAVVLVEQIQALISKDQHLDIIGGAAGCIGALLSLYRCTPSECILAAAIQCGDHLIAQAQPQDRSIGWISKVGGTKPLTGFSHGAAGMAWALLELAALTDEDRFRTAAMAAIAYERSCFSPTTGNWADLRAQMPNSPSEAAIPAAEGSNKNTFTTTWCQGAPGIGLARLYSLNQGRFTNISSYDHAVVRAEINTALKTTLAHGFGLNHSLCHGDLGNLELLLQASETLEPQWRPQVNRLGAAILESIREHGWLCGTPLGVETPGLMTGLAGIGYGLLRLAEPRRIPSVLVLAPPQ